MGKLRKIVFYSMIPIVIICMIEGLVYYREMGLKEIEKIFCSLDNTVKLFLARPTIQPAAAFRSISDKYTDTEVAITYIYSILVIVAPILMTTAIVAGFSAYIFDFVNSIKISFRERMFIFGDGAMTKVIAGKYSKKYYVHYMMPAETPDEDRVPLLKQKVKAYQANYDDIAPYCKSARLEKAAYVVLNFADWYKSYKTAVDVIEYLIDKREERTLPVYIVDSPGTLRMVFENMYAGLCQKHDKESTILTISYINVNDANAHNFFKEHELTAQPDNKHHIVFVGLGGYGRAMLKELIMYMDKNGMTGTVEILDHTIETSMNSLAYSVASIDNADKFTMAETVRNAKFSTDIRIEAGVIRTNYYQVKIGEIKATEYLSGILENGKVTEFFCCLQNTASCFECYRMVEGYGDILKDTKLYFRVGPDLMKYFEPLRLGSKLLEFMPDDFPDIELIEETQEYK